VPTDVRSDQFISIKKKKKSITAEILAQFKSIAVVVSFPAERKQRIWYSVLHN